MVLVETPLFTRQITSLLSDDEYQQFQEWLSDHPDLGSRIPGASGLRKIRLALQGRGKRGGARVIYLWQVRQDKILLLYAYRKNDVEDLSAALLAQLAAIALQEMNDETGTIQ